MSVLWEKFIRIEAFLEEDKTRESPSSLAARIAELDSCLEAEKKDQMDTTVASAKAKYSVDESLKLLEPKRNPRLAIKRPTKTG